MSKRTRSERGMTLVELSVVLAVIAIVSTMVVTFVLMVSSRRKAATDRLAALSDIELIESVTESWIEQNSGCSVEESRLYNGKSEIVFSDAREFIFNGTTMPLDTVEDIMFQAEQSEGETLYICTVTYKVADKPETYIFCVNPYVGEGVAQ